MSAMLSDMHTEACKIICMKKAISIMPVVKYAYIV